jgi:uncharacterized protein involved in exopolysaccharide biosynthesis
MKRVFTTAAGFLGGAIAGYVLAFAAYLSSQRSAAVSTVKAP